MQSRVVRPTRLAGPASSQARLDQWQSPSNITTFVRCLRLLDLDRLPDWPGITENIFASKPAQQNLQARVKAVEWSLYRLFEIYDPKETQTKLRPFFPPLAPLQSLNLRAAVYRALTELKKNGVLGKDVVLRKTMLDDCKDQKLEGVIKEFALVVLRKACKSREPSQSLHQIETIPKEQLVPLILAYRYSLQQSLQQRQSHTQCTQDHFARLALAQADLRKRLEEAQQDFKLVDEKDLAHFSEMVRSAWPGDDRWCDILLNGQRHSAINPFPDSVEFLTTEARNKRRAQEAGSTDLAAELNKRIEEQKNRLGKWKTFHASMINAQGGKMNAFRNCQSAGNPLCLRFDQHKDLRLEVQLQQPAEERLEPYHASVIRNMHSELAALRSFVSSPIVSHPGRDDDHMTSSQAHILDNVREPTVNHDAAETWTSSRMTSPVQDGDLSITDGLIERTPHSYMSERICEENTNTTVSVGARIFDTSPKTASSTGERDSMNMPSSPPVGLIVDESTPQVSNLSWNEEAASAAHVTSLKRISTSTLLERTRASMLPFAMDQSLSGACGDETSDIHSDESQLLPTLPALMAPRGTLLERTRQSMSLLPHPPSKSKASQSSSAKQARFSEIYPVNQFETPNKAQTPQAGARSPRSGASTPRDSLFSDEADYTSVFKSRPRIAVSPALSPERSTVGLDSMLAAGVDDLDLGNSCDSPIRVL